MIDTPVVETGVYLRSFLEPLAAFLKRPEVTDIYVNRPGELWAETLGGNIERHDIPSLTDGVVMGLARQVAALSHQGVSREHPLLSASLPDGARLQVVGPPATRGPLALAIRKHVAAELTLADYAQAGAFGATMVGSDEQSAIDRELSQRLAAGDVAGTLAAAVRARRTILVSGGTSTGKTTFVNALLCEIPATERLILIEDTPELRMTHANSVGLIATRGALGEASVTADDLVGAALRMRPDRIILGELRGDEAYAFLRAVNTGHPGSMTTVHADSPEGAIEQIALLVLQRGGRLSRQDVKDYVRSVVGVFVQLARSGGRRYVEQIVLRDRERDI